MIFWNKSFNKEIIFDLDVWFMKEELIKKKNMVNLNSIILLILEKILLDVVKYNGEYFIFDCLKKRFFFNGGLIRM